MKFTLEQAMKAQKGGTCIALLFLEPQLEMGVDGQLHAGAAFPPWKRLGIHYIGAWVALGPV